MEPINPNDPANFKPNDTLSMRLQRSKSGPAVVGTSTGMGGAAVVLWLASLMHVNIDPVTASVIGGAVTSIFGGFIRKKLSQ